MQYLQQFTSKDDKRPALNGVYHGNGYAVATNTHILVAETDMYDEKNDGKVVLKDGNAIDGSKYPNWQNLVPKKAKFIHFWIDPEEASKCLSKVDEQCTSFFLIDRIILSADVFKLAMEYMKRHKFYILQVYDTYFPCVIKLHDSVMLAMPCLGENYYGNPATYFRVGSNEYFRLTNLFEDL